MQIHCPECKSAHIIPIVETTDTGGTAVHSSITRNIGISSYTPNSIHRNYWMCSACGEKFRNIKNLQEEIASEIKRMKLGKLCIGLFLILLMLSLSSDVLFMLFGIISLIALIMSIFILFSTKKKITAMNDELLYLRTNCFN